MAVVRENAKNYFKRAFPDGGCVGGNPHISLSVTIHLVGILNRVRKYVVTTNTRILSPPI